MVRPLEKKVASLEARIGELEDAQKARSVALADPAVYADEARKRTLLDEYQSAADALDGLSAEWELAQGDLEAALATLDD